MPFHDDVEALLAAAAEIEDDDDAGLVFLVEEGHMRFDAEGRRTARLRRVYRIDSPSRIESGGRSRRCGSRGTRRGRRSAPAS